MISRVTNSDHFLHFILFHVIFILLASKARNNTVLGLTNETDFQALLAVKDRISGDPFSVPSSWNNSLHFCQWKGITCSRRRQRVTMLNLSSLDLVGSLSPQIGNLSFLRAIDLQNNNFHGTIPQEIGQLFRLRRLQFHANSFQGNIPTILGSLSNLLELRLSDNKLIGQIPPSLGNLSSLRVLKMAHNNLFDRLPLQLCNLSSIQEFGINDNQLHGELPLELGLTLQNLKGFYISVNKFSGSFPPSIANASGLTRFDIGANSFNGPLPMNLGSLHNLEVLNLYRNQLGTNQPNELSLLVKSLINCTKLQFLDVGENGFIGELPYSILNLSTTLTYLDLSGNYLFGSIPKEIGNLFNLRKLGLNENMLTGSIPKCIGKLSKLELLYLYTNNISGEIPSSIGNLSRLSLLNLHSNMLHGSIPITFVNCTNLLFLHLERNSLTDTIHEQFVGHSSTIIDLRLGHNQLIGALPSNMGNFKNLVELDISGNKLTNEIPSTLGNCLMLTTLYIDDNLFQGTIPSSFKQLKDIQVMDLSYNNLSGQIPSFLGELRLFQKLNLSHNMFEGEVPTRGVFGNITMFSLVGNLQLCGGIQALQLPACQVKHAKKTRKSFPRRIIPLLIVLPILILFVCIALILYRSRRSKEQNPSGSLLKDRYPKLSYGELARATNGFSLTNLIGEGRYGSVYKGILNAGEQVFAVKVLNVELRGANTTFLAECETFRNIRHRNLVKIITACSSIDFKGSDFKALVLEYMPNGSLDKWLHPSPSEQQNTEKLSLLQRLCIAIDVASAVEYLHRHCQTKIVHCDLKPSNILLDEEFDAHVGDFGLAKILSDTTSEINHLQTSSIGIRGTTGYVPPEYGMGGEVSTQGDVYSYGILLLEMFTGKRPTNSMFTDSVNLCNYVSKALPQNVMEIIDFQLIMDSEDGSTITESSSITNNSKMKVCLTSILQIGVLCCAERPKERMDIGNVLGELIMTRNLYVGVTRERKRE